MGGELSRVRTLSDRDLLLGLNGSLRANRRAVADVVLHLGEVEERRLHLLGGHGSLFAYCVARLGMSEDEACRRIDVARLARRFPRLFEGLASGQLSLSVAVLLKRHLTTENHEALLVAVSGKTTQQAREVLAAWFPRPDVLPLIRKLPAPHSHPEQVGHARGDVIAPHAPAGLHGRCAQGRLAIQLETRESAPSASNQLTESRSNEMAFAARVECSGMSAEMVSMSCESPAVARPARREPTEREMPGAEQYVATAAASAIVARLPESAGVCTSMAPGRAVWQGHAAGVPTDGAEGRMPGSPAAVARRHPGTRSIEPLSPGRYKVQLTASAELKDKLELARDLLRHTIPSGDWAAILERALDLLIERTMKRRFGAGVRSKKTCAAKNSASGENGSNPDGAKADVSGEPATRSDGSRPARPEGFVSARSRDSVPGHRAISKAERAASALSSATDESATDESATDENATDENATDENATDESATGENATGENAARECDGHADDESGTGAGRATWTSATESLGVPKVSGNEGGADSGSATGEPWLFVSRTPTPRHSQNDDGHVGRSGADPSVPVAKSFRTSSRTPQTHSRHIPNTVRRSVLSRDQGRCTWHGSDGTRCDSRAWIEHDHVAPRGLGGDHSAANVRHLCRPHNRLAAEQAYGRDTISRIIASRRVDASRKPACEP